VELALGIDIGGTTTKLALVDPEGRITGRASFSTSDRKSESDFFRSLFFSVAGLMDHAGGEFHLAGIGAGAPSANEREGTIENAANLPFSPKVEFVKTLEQQYGLPVFLVKDSNASTLGEMHYGAARGMENFILLTLGTGLGCGVVVDGRLLSGKGGHASEAGHVCVMPLGRECGCGRKGCLETYVSATGLKRTVFEFLTNSLTDSRLRNIGFEKMTSKAIAQAAADGDQLALQAFDFTGEILGRALADMAAWFDPEAIFLSGGLAAAGDLLFEPTAKNMEACLLDFFKGKIKLLPSALGENDAALLGAASLVWREAEVMEGK
jgi:glucokinase